MGAEARVQCLAQVRRQLFVRRVEVAECISRETGKPLAEALSTEVLTGLDMVRFCERHAPAFLQPARLASSTLAMWRKRLTIARAPYGVVGIISPWNYPFMLPAGHAMAALVTGNTVVLKPSELTPLSGALVGDLCAKAGVPAGVLEVVQGAGDVGRALVAGAVDKVFFTGSVASGRHVAAACASRLVPCALELGGSDPAIVLHDADLEHAARGIAWGRFVNAGQTCVAAKRVYVIDAVHDAFVRALEQQVRQLHLRAPNDSSWDVGPLITAGAVEPISRLREAAVAAGARVIQPAAPSVLAGAFPPTLLLDVPAGAAVLTEETFGPLLPVVRVPDEAAAIAAANASPFGLSASVWSRSRRRARAVAARLHAGSVAINDVTLVAGMADVPHGGVKASGYGRAHGMAGLEECVRTKAVVDDILPSVRQPWWFPYGAALAPLLDGYLRLAHGDGLGERCSGLVPTLRLLLRRN